MSRDPEPSRAQQDAIEAEFVETVYDAAHLAHLQRLGREPVPAPSQRAIELWRRANERVASRGQEMDISEAASRLAGDDVDVS